MVFSFANLPSAAHRAVEESYAAFFSKKHEHHALWDAEANMLAFCAARDAVWDRPPEFSQMAAKLFHFRADPEFRFRRRMTI